MSASVCFLGTGKMNARHIRVLRKVRAGIKIGVASRDAKRAREFADRLRLADSFGGYEEAIGSSYSTMVIGVPPSAHARLMRMCLDAGKNVLCEKPVFQSLNELRALWAGMTGHEATVLVAENFHYTPFHKEMKAWLASGRFGAPYFHDLFRLGRVEPKGWRADPEEMPLGALHEGGVHWIRRIQDLASAFEDDGTSGTIGVTAFSMPVTTKTPNEDTSVIVSRHRSGLVSRLVHSWALPRRRQDFSKFVLQNGAIHYDPRGVWARARGAGGGIILPTLGDTEGFKAMWTDLVECVEQGRRPELTLTQIWEDFAYLDAAYRSMKSGKEERPDPVPAG